MLSDSNYTSLSLAATDTDCSATMEGGVDMDERVETPPNAERQEPVAEEEQEEGNKFQKAIGAWRSANSRDAYDTTRLTMRQTSTSPLSFRSSTR